MASLTTPPTHMFIDSKLPHVGTTIFTVVSQRAQELGAINLAQGFPDYDPPEPLKELLATYALGHDHQYAPMAGLPRLREQIAVQFERRHGARVDPVNEITITLGATEALFSSIIALVKTGDEVILLDPSYDSYAPSVLLAGGVPIHIALAPPAFGIEWDRVAAAITERTRMIVVNSPHNPTGTVMNEDDVRHLEQIATSNNLIVLSDEVYEHMTYDGRTHLSMVARPALRDRAISVFSFGKPLHATGWRVGFAIASNELTRELRRVHQFNTFTIATPLQSALAEFMANGGDYFNELKFEYQTRRDRFIEGLRGQPLSIQPSAGTYFQTVDFRAITQLNDVEIADRLIREAGVAVIPISPFYAEKPLTQVVRFCFAKKNATLDEATSRLRNWMNAL